jgi:hypothetical protein
MSVRKCQASNGLDGVGTIFGRGIPTLRVTLFSVATTSNYAVTAQLRFLLC